MEAVRKIFVSSTYKDLASYRQAVEDVVRDFGELFVGMEHFGARSTTPLETCLSEVAASQVVVVLVGARYGSRTPDGKSFTHHEVEHARAHKIPVLLFVQSNPQPVSRAESARRERFLRWMHDYTRATFDDALSLTRAVASALHRAERESASSSNGDAWLEIAQRADAAADWDCVTISAHNVDHLHSVDLVAPGYETTAQSSVVAPGGSGANTMAGLGRVGLRVAAAGLVGNDRDGAFLRAALEIDGVAPLLAPLGRMKCATGSTVIFTDGRGERSIYVRPGANAYFATAARDRAYAGRLSNALRSTRILHLSSFASTRERGLQAALLRHLPSRALVSFTPGAFYCKLGLDRLRPLLMRTNILFLYEPQLNALLDGEVANLTNVSGPEALRRKLDRFYAWKRELGYGEPMAVIVKRGAPDSSTTPEQLIGGVGRTSLEAFAPTQAVLSRQVVRRDSTGAGDAAAAGLLRAVLRRESLDDALDCAYVFARSATREIGGRAGLPTEQEFRRRWAAWVQFPRKS